MAVNNKSITIQLNDLTLISRQDFKNQINRWIHDYGTLGHFEQISSKAFQYGMRVDINHSESGIINVFGNTNLKSSVSLETPVSLGRVYGIYDIQVDSNGITNSKALIQPNTIQSTDYICPSSIVGTGKDGAFTATSSHIINTYAYLTASTSSAAKSISINSTTGFHVGDEILIIQTQTNNSNYGSFEFNTITAINGSVLSLQNPTKTAYTSGTFSARPSQVSQVIRIPHYTNVTVPSGTTIYAKTYDRYSGGIVIFRATGSVTINGTIHANGCGFCGGSYRSCGEGYYGYIVDGGSSGNSGTNGAYRTWNSSGNPTGSGGGGNAGWTANGNNLLIFTLSGGGGSGGGAINYYDRGVAAGGAGGAGAGNVFIFAQKILNYGSILARGIAGSAGGWTHKLYGGGGGGGGGGCIYLHTPILVNSGTIDSIGGAGGATSAYGGGGAAGASGVVNVNTGLFNGNSPTNCTSVSTILQVNSIQTSTFMIQCSLSSFDFLSSISIDLSTTRRFLESVQAGFLLSTDRQNWFYRLNGNWIQGNLETILQNSMTQTTLQSLQMSDFFDNHFIQQDTQYIYLACNIQLTNPFNSWVLRSITLSGKTSDQSPFNIRKFNTLDGVGLNSIQTINL